AQRQLRASSGASQEGGGFKGPGGEGRRQGARNRCRKGQGRLRGFERPLRRPLSSRASANGAGANLHGIIAELVQRTATDESRQLQARVDRLQAELAEATAPAPKTSAATGSSSYSPSDLEDIIRKVRQEERAFTRACFAGIEDRLLPEKRIRPPLAADRAPVAMPAPAMVPSTSGQPQGPKPSKGKRKGKKSQAAAPLAPSTCADAQVELGTVQAAPLSQPDDAGELSATPPTETRTEVVKRGKGKKAAPKTTPAAPAAKRAPTAPLNKVVRLAAPRTAAVTVTITPERPPKGVKHTSPC
ncbi:hypothetical protein SFRURICE_012773, partial [Spodoptera frugiperda]